MNLNCLIVDDDALCQGFLERYCAKTEGLNVVGVCNNGQEALKSLSSSIDLIFLDMEMPEMDGLSFLDHAPMVPSHRFDTHRLSYATDICGDGLRSSDLFAAGTL